MKSVSSGDARRAGCEQLSKAGITSASLDTDLMLASAMNVEYATIVSHAEILLSKTEELLFANHIKRRLRREPLAYIVGTREFYGIDLYVDPRVLIPRPATECLVDRALDWWTSMNRAPNADSNASLIVDVGVGSGAIALALATHLPTAVIVGSDISRDAVKVAVHNAHRLGLQRRAHIVVADFQPITRLAPNLVVANLPYIPTAEISSLEPEICDFEPCCALSGGADGFDLYRCFLDQVRVRPGGAVIVEIGYEQASLLSSVVRKVDSQLSLELTPDLEGFNRIGLISGW